MNGGFVFNLVRLIACLPEWADKRLTERAIKQAYGRMVCADDEHELTDMYQNNVHVVLCATVNGQPEDVVIDIRVRD